MPVNSRSIDGDQKAQHIPNNQPADLSRQIKPQGI